MAELQRQLPGGDPAGRGCPPRPGTPGHGARGQRGGVRLPLHPGRRAAGDVGRDPGDPGPAPRGARGAARPGGQPPATCSRRWRSSSRSRGCWPGCLGSAFARADGAGSWRARSSTWSSPSTPGSGPSGSSAAPPSSAWPGPWPPIRCWCGRPWRGCGGGSLLLVPCGGKAGHRSSTQPAAWYVSATLGDLIRRHTVPRFDDTRVIARRRSRTLRRLLARGPCFPLPFLVFLLFLGEISLTLLERVVGFGHLRSSSIGPEV